MPWTLPSTTWVKEIVNPWESDAAIELKLGAVPSLDSLVPLLGICW